MFELEARGPTQQGGGFQTVGLYASLPTDPPPKDPRVYDFFKACGSNYLEFCEAGFRSRPDLLPEYYKDLSSAITLAHDKGFRVGIVLLAGMEQMCRSAELTPERLIDEYAGFVADEKTRGVLGRVLRYVENHSNWQNSLPVEYHLRDFDLPHALSAPVALDLLAQVKPRVQPAIPLLEPPAIYLGRLKKRLEAIAAGHIGGTSG